MRSARSISEGRPEYCGRGASRRGRLGSRHLQFHGLHPRHLQGPSSRRRFEPSVGQSICDSSTSPRRAADSGHIIYVYTDLDGPRRSTDSFRVIRDLTAITSTIRQPRCPRLDNFLIYFDESTSTDGGFSLRHKQLSCLHV